MGMKAVLFTDPECGKVCVDAESAVKKYMEAGEIEKMEIREGLKKYDLGEPEGVPFVGFISESTGKCVNRMFFHDEKGEVMIQPYPSVSEESVETHPEAEQHGKDTEE